MTTPTLPSKISTVKPPYAPPISAPLSGVQREVILTYLDKFANNGDTNKDAFAMALVSGLDWTQFQEKPVGSTLLASALKNYRSGQYDATTVSVYNSFARGAVMVPPGYQNDVTHTYNLPSIPGISSVTDFLKLLADPNTWLRVAEVLVGVILLGIGVAKMSTSGARIVKATPIGKLT